MWAEFKEKPFENAFLAELARHTNIQFSPDQTDEGLLGFDGAFFLPLPKMHLFFPYVRFRRWRHLVGMTASEIDSFGAVLDARLPPFNLNLFVQYKRPEWLKQSNATEWSSWGHPYFRYTIEPKQQGLLEKIANTAAGRAAVIYAAAAFWKSSDLFALGLTNEIISNSNLASAELLSGHQRLTYAAAGSFGIAHSEPENVEGPSLATILAGGESNERLPFTKHMKMTAGLIDRTLGDDSGDYQLLQAARAAMLGGELGDVFPRDQGSWIDALISIAAFTQAFDIRIVAVG